MPGWLGGEGRDEGMDTLLYKRAETGNITRSFWPVDSGFVIGQYHRSCWVVVVTAILVLVGTSGPNSRLVQL